MDKENLPAVQTHADPFNRSLVTHHPSINAGVVSIEQERAIAEAQGQLTLAKRFPRSLTAAISEFMDACNSPEFAATAFYTVKNRGSGPSIRMAEEAARCYGNFVYGHRELSRSEGKSEIEVYAWDMEKNNRSTRQITVMHVLDTTDGPRKLTQQADIDNKIANVASKQMRGRILALMPKHMMAAGIAAAKRTLAGGGEKPLSERLIAMAQAFAKFGVTNDHLVAHLGHAVDNTTIDELADLMGIYNAIRDGAKASEFFGQHEKAEATASRADAIAARAAAGKPAAQAPAPAPAAAPAPATKATTRGKPQPQPEQASKTAESEGNSTQETAAGVEEKQAPAAQPQATQRQAPPPSSGAADDDDVF